MGCDVMVFLEMRSGPGRCPQQPPVKEALTGLGQGWKKLSLQGQPAGCPRGVSEAGSQGYQQWELGDAAADVSK